jgi:MFS family permease
VSAGIGILGIASPMIQEVFKGRVSASAAAGFAGLLSLFNIGGRIFWASLSDRIGRKATYAIFFALGIVLYASVPIAGSSGNLALFVAIFCVVLTMYGGGFATIPAYLADLFGVHYVSAIHGRLLTAWSTAGILGPVLVNYIREFQISRGIAAADAYTFTMYVLVGLLAVGFVCNMLVRPVRGELFVVVTPRTRPSPPEPIIARPQGPSRQWGLATSAWALTAIPLGWGVFRTLTLASQMFR